MERDRGRIRRGGQTTKGDRLSHLDCLTAVRAAILPNVLSEGIKLLVGLWRRPASGMGAVLDRGSAVFALVAALAVAFLLQVAGPLAIRFYMPVALLALIYVPGLLLAGALAGRLGGVGAIFQRDYSALFTCAAMAWTAVVVPLAAAGWALPEVVFPWAAAAAFIFFAVQMFFAVRTLFGLGNGTAWIAVTLSWLFPAVAALFWPAIHYVLGWVASPFFIFYAWYFLGGELSSLGSGLSGRQSFQRMLEAAAINPHDADAQFQIGLIHQQRRQYTEATRRFRNAVNIDPEETGAHFQLGRIAREQGRNEEALAEFETVRAQDEKHSLSEVRRELGAAHYAVGRLADARRELEIYTDRRPYDPEGLYYYGQVLEALGDNEVAKAAYGAAVEAARTAPRYRRRLTAKWSRLAQRQAKKL